MSFKAAIRAYLFSDATLTASVSQYGTVVTVLEEVGNVVVLVTVSGLSSAPSARGQLLLKTVAGNYEFIDYTAVAANGENYEFTTSAVLTNSYAAGSYAAVAEGIYSYPAPQAATLPYLMIDRLSTDEVLNKLNGQATVVFESWQINVFARTDAQAETIKDALAVAMNLVNPTTWSDDGFATAYTVDTAVWTADVPIPELDDDGSQNAIIEKAETFAIKRSIASA